MRYNGRMNKNRIHNLIAQLAHAGMDKTTAQKVVMQKARRLKAAEAIKKKKQLEEHASAHAHDIENPAQSEINSDDVTPPTPVKAHGKKSTRTKKARANK